MDYILPVLIGLGLAAACGFRVFVPLLVLSIAAHSGAVKLDPSFAWLGTTPALVAFGAATLFEVLGYWIPWVDHALDTIATPAAVVAGTIAAASQFHFVGSQGAILKWGAAAIAGGGLAGLVQIATVTIRGLSTLTTMGLANPIVGTVETGMAATLSLIAVFATLLVGAVLVAVVIAAIWLLYVRRRAVVVAA